MNISLRTEMYC